MEVIGRIFPLTSQWLYSTSAHTTFIDNSSLDVSKEKVKSLAIFSQINATSLLFQCAVSYAHEGHFVVFITQTPLSRLPLPVHAMPSPTAHVLGNVKFMYLENLAGVIGYLCGVHQTPRQPAVIVIDDLQSYLSHVPSVSLEQTVAKLVALLTDAVSLSGHGSQQGHLAISVTGRLRASLVNVLDRFHITVANLEEVRNESGTMFELRVETSATQTLSCVYSAGDKYLHLSTITQRESPRK